MLFKVELKTQCDIFKKKILPTTQFPQEIY